MSPRILFTVVVAGRVPLLRLVRVRPQFPLVVVELIGLPPVIQVAFGGFTVFAALKISYGASIGRTLALCVVSLVIVGAVAYLAHGCVPS